MTEPGEKMHEFGMSESELADYLDRLDAAGWIAGGADHASYPAGATTGMQLARKVGRLSPRPAAYIQAFGMADERGILEHGYFVDADEATGALMLGYDGAVNERYRNFLEDAIAAGRILDAAQALDSLAARYGDRRVDQIIDELKPA